jgi:signal transduction histidine kinase
MKTTDYIKDRIPAYLIFAGSIVMELAVLFAFHISVEATVIVSVTECLALSIAETWNYLRKKNYYQKLSENLEGLDKKYLLSEMSEQPNFLEGKIFHEILCETNKSMCDEVSDQRRKNSEFREFLEAWVHEIKLPVAALELMCHNDGNTKYNGQLNRIDTYIENVLYYARSGSSEKDYIIKNVSLKQVFTECAIRHREEILERKITLETDSLDFNVMTDSKWLSYMIGQIIDNSMKYGASKIKVSAMDEQEMTVLHLRDNGIGISASDLPYIFEKSFTGENGRSGTKSTGMGLYIVKKLCDRLGHGISADSVQGEYTEIKICFGKNDFIDSVVKH